MTAIFDLVTSDFDELKKTVTIDQNHRSRPIKFIGHDPSKSPVTIDQNTHSRYKVATDEADCMCLR